MRGEGIGCVLRLEIPLFLWLRCNDCVYTCWIDDVGYTCAICLSL